MASIDEYKKYEDLLARYQGFNPTKYQQGFEKDYGEATNWNKDLIDQKADVVGRMQSLPAELRAKYAQSSIRNPLEQEALIAQRRGTQTADLNRLTDFLGARGARYEDVLSKYTQAYMTDAQMAQQAAESQWRIYQDQLAQEEAARARAAAAAQQAWLENFYDNSNTPQDEVVDDSLAIEVDDRSLGTRLVDKVLGYNQTLNNTIGQNPLVKSITSSPFGKTLEKGFVNAIGGLMGSPFGQSFMEQSKYSDILKGLKKVPKNTSSW